jgi:hypothetical protein
MLQKELLLLINSYRQIQRNKVLISLTNTRLNGLSTNSFIYNRQIKADYLISNGGSRSIYKTLQKEKGTESFEFENIFFDEAIVKNIVIGKTILSVTGKANENEAPLLLKNVEFSAANIDSIYSGIDILKLFGSSSWDFKAD